MENEKYLKKETEQYGYSSLDDDTLEKIVQCCPRNIKIKNLWMSFDGRVPFSCAHLDSIVLCISSESCIRLRVVLNESDLLEGGTELGRNFQDYLCIKIKNPHETLPHGVLATHVYDNQITPSEFRGHKFSLFEPEASSKSKLQHFCGINTWKYPPCAWGGGGSTGSYCSAAARFASENPRPARAYIYIYTAGLEIYHVSLCSRPARECERDFTFSRLAPLVSSSYFLRGRKSRSAAAARRPNMQRPLHIGPPRVTTLSVYIYIYFNFNG